MKKYIEMAKAAGADIAIEIKASSVVTAPWVIHKCKFGCEDYHRKLFTCPPNTPTWKETQEIIDCFSRGIIFRMHEEGVITGVAAHIANEMFKDDYYKAICFGAGDCRKCTVCAHDHCRFPKQCVTPAEACGIDVFVTVRNNGLEIHTLREMGEPMNCFGIILAE